MGILFPTFLTLFIATQFGNLGEHWGGNTWSNSGFTNFPPYLQFYKAAFSINIKCWECSAVIKKTFYIQESMKRKVYICYVFTICYKE